MAARAKKIMTGEKVETKGEASEVSSGASARRPKIKIFVLLIVLVILAALAYKFRGAIIVATVDGKPITRFEVWRELETQGGKQVLDSIISKELVMQEAQKKGITVSDADVNNEIKSYEDELKKQNQTLDAVLAMQGDTRAAFTDRVRFRQVVMKLLADKLAVTDDEVTKYMTDNKSILPTGQTPDALKAQVRQQLEQQKLSSQLQAYIDGLKASAKIQYLYTY